MRQLLKRFGIYIYIGERIADLTLMEIELKELYQLEFITANQYQLAFVILKKENFLLKEDRAKAEKINNIVTFQVRYEIRMRAT